MEGEMGTFDFVLALDLHKTIAELGEMPSREYLAWQAFYKYRAAMAELDEGA
jgi:hypothetical protein